ncbi:DUF4365 domain-containing protein [Kribbella sp. CA-253562]|uniref:DUF4365 domain-containing protein n=1 Tax=Kribbella sp. CA-253562 TaxID=3239942 RepID=UPI003D8AECAA
MHSHDRAERMGKDYGEEATEHCLFVQAKATRHMSRHTTREDRFIQYPFKVSHLNNWKRFWEPVVLSAWDAEADLTYWEIAQTPEREPKDHG